MPLECGEYMATMAKPKKKQVSIRIPEDDYEFLDMYCEEEGIERATWMASVIHKEVRRIQQQDQTVTQ